MKKELLVASALVTTLGMAGIAEAASATFSGKVRTGVAGSDTDGTADGTFGAHSQASFTVSLAETLDSGTKVSTGFDLTDENDGSTDTSGITLTFTDGSKLDLMEAGNAYASKLATVPAAGGETGVTGTTLNSAPSSLSWANSADNIGFDKKDKFIVYQGSHGDRGAEIADIILPGAAYTEKNGLFVNLEGKLQNAYKASYPPGEAREDWIIFKDLANMMKRPLGYSNVKHLRESIYKHIQQKINNKAENKNKVDFVDDTILIKSVDYYYTNPIARSSKVMGECRKISKSFLFTGIEKAS